MSEAPTSAVVLAAGKATRMGSQKQLLRVGDMTLIEHTLGQVRAAGVNDIIVVLGAAGGEIEQKIAGPGLKIIHNPAFEEGMGTSLQAGIRAVDGQAEAVLVVLADQPLVKAETLRQIIASYNKHKPQILIPLYRGFRGNPVLLDRSMFPEIAQLNGDMGCRAIFGDHLENIRKLTVDDAGVLIDVDRVEDLEQVRGIVNGTPLDIPLMEESTRVAGRELIVVGRESVATALVKLARLLKFQVTVFEPLLTLKEMPEANRIVRKLDFSLLESREKQYCVVASMGRFDEEAIDQALAAGIPYIAIVANKKRSQEVLQGLELAGVPRAKLELVRTKPGLAIGAEGPEEIALAIMAEIVSLKTASS